MEDGALKIGEWLLVLADSRRLLCVGLGDMLMLWDGNVMYVLFEAGSEAVLSSE